MKEETLKDNWNRMAELSRKPNKTQEEKNELTRRINFHNRHSGDCY